MNSAKRYLLGCRSSPQQIDLITTGLAPDLALSPEQLKRAWPAQLALLSRQKLRRALKNAVGKRLTVPQAREIASMINVSLDIR